MNCLHLISKGFGEPFPWPLTFESFKGRTGPFLRRVAEGDTGDIEGRWCTAGFLFVVLCN